MPKKTATLEWCVVRLGEDHNWWVDEISDDVHWDADNLSIIDPRQIDYILDMTEPLKEYGFDPDVLDRALIPFRIDAVAGEGRVRLTRVGGSLLESEDKLFGLPDVVDEENGPYADFLDHVTRCRVKMLNDTMDFEEKLTVDEVEEEIREEQNNLFMEGRSIHLFTELAAILDYVPAGWDDEDEGKKKVIEEDDADAGDADFELDSEEEEKLKNDASLRWEDEEGEEKDEDEEEKPVEAPVPEGFEDFGSDDEEDEEDEESPASKKKGGAKVAEKKAVKAPAKPAAKPVPASKKPAAKKEAAAPKKAPAKKKG
jgi:hypothetical protein